MADIIFEDVSRETFETVSFYFQKNKTELVHYLNELIWWNNRINLMSRTISRSVMEEHIFHSLLFLAFDSFHDSTDIVDVGSGGGLPAIPLAICDREKNYILSELVQKKCIALRDMTHKVGIHVDIIEGDIEQAAIPANFQTYITKHAFKVSELVRLLSGKPWKRLLMLKGSDIIAEAAALSPEYYIVAHALEKGTIKSFYSGKYFVEVRPV